MISDERQQTIFVTTTFSTHSTHSAEGGVLAKFAIPPGTLLPDVEDPKLKILKYEFDMFFMMRLMWSPASEWPALNAFTECAVVHARNLCNFFCGPDKRQDIRRGDIFDLARSPRLSELIKKLNRAYNREKDGVVPRESFSSFVAHMGSGREEHAGGYNYQREFAAVEPPLRQIRDEVVLPLFQERAAKSAATSSDA
jgi:hypothetical protein